MSYYGFRPYVPVAVRREKAAREMAKLAKKGRAISPVAIEGKKIASTFWGKSWCENLERYSDYENRLPRGRTYVRNGSVVDLQIERGRVRATVSGSELYTVAIDIAVSAKLRWEAICKDCAGSIGSLVELLQGKLSKNVMERVCREVDGLFPSPDEITMQCSCPDWSVMCKHVSAALYGVGARLDAKPDLLFELRGVDRSQLISGAGKDLPMTQRPVAGERVLAEDDIAALFGIEMDAAPASSAAVVVEKAARSPERGSAPPVSSAPAGAALNERSTGGRTAKPKAGSATTGKRGGPKGATASASLEVSGRPTVAAAKPPQPSALASKRPIAVSQPVSAPPLAKTGRRVRILALNAPRWKKPKAR
jgi:uncharacterized Zn finger protein